jgi:uncharacterized membrane protein YbhN (UPF0104 family)
MTRGRKDPARWLAPHTVALLVGIAAGLSAAALIGIAWSAGAGKVLHALVHPQWLWLGVAVAGEVVAYVGYTAAYREIAAAEDGAELKAPRAAALVATGFGAFVHGGGFALDRVALRRSGLSEREARRRVAGLAMLEYTILVPATTAAAAAVLLKQQAVSASLTLPWIAGAPIGAVLAVMALRHRKQVAALPRVGKRLDHGLHSLSLVLRLLGSPQRHALAPLGALAYWGGDVFALWATLHAFSAQPPPLAPLIVGYASGYALSRRALPLGGAGVVEALLTYSLVWLEIAIVPALLAVFAYRLINLWVPMIPALVGIPTLRRLQGPQSRRKTGASTA